MKGARRFESPPRRQAVIDLRALCGKSRKQCACSRIFLWMRRPEKCRFGRQQLNYARFSLSRIEPVPDRAIVCQNALARGVAFSEEIRLFLTVDDRVARTSFSCLIDSNHRQRCWAS